MYFDKKNNKIISNNQESSQENKPKVLREMLSIVPVDENGNKPGREMLRIVPVDENGNKPGRPMVEIIDNSKPRIMCTTDMVRVVEQPIAHSAIPYNHQNNLPINPPISTSIASSYAESVSFKFENGVMSFNNVPFLNCSIEIVETIYSETQNYYRCRIYIGGEYLYKNVKVSDFSTGKWIHSITGVSTMGDRGVANHCLYQYLDFLLLNLDLSNKSHLYQKPGWQCINNNYYYITPQGVIDGLNVKASSECGQKFSSLEPDYSYFSKYLNLVNATSSHVATILVLYTALSLCNTLFKKANFTPKFILFVYGPRGNFKTSLSLALTQLEYRDTPPFTLKATQAAIESNFRNYKDSPLLLDDLCPALQKSDRKKMESTLETITRAFGDATAHRRCTLQYSEDKANKIGQYEAEGGCVLTGEYFTGCESSLARTLFVELKKESVNLELLSYIQNDRHLTERFAVTFITCLTRMINDDNNMDIIGFIETRGKELRKEYGFRYSNERYSEYLAQLSTVADLLLLVASYFNFLTPQEIQQYRTRFSKAIIDIVEENNTRLIAQNPTTVLCNAIKSAIEDEKVLYYPLGSVVHDYDNVIFYKDEFLYLTQKGCAKLANDYLKENDITLAEFSSARVANTLENSNIIFVFTEGSTKRMATKLSGYGSKRFMKISRTELDRHSTL